MIGWLLGTRVGRVLSAAVAGLTLLLGVVVAARRDAAQDALQDARKKDQDNADAIRDRVRDVPDRLREFEGRGFRD